MTAPSACTPEMRIGNRAVSARHPCFVIAEIGVNHNGDVDCARRLIDAAVAAGADAAKFQSFRTSELVTAAAPKAAYQERHTGSGGQAEMLAALELSPGDFAVLNDHCRDAGIEFISTAFDRQSLADVMSLRPNCLKWPSGELNNRPLLRQAAQSGLPIILSTGMAYLSEVAATLEFLAQEGSGDVAILHCVSAYPAALADQNLACIPNMAAAFQRPVGLSDHTDGPWAAIAARGLGMAIVEKHITLDRQMAGPDHAASMEPGPFAELVRVLREVEAGLGDGVKQPVASELGTRDVARKSLVFRSGLPAGHVLREEDLLAKRPAGGISPDLTETVTGRTLLRDVAADEQVGWHALG